MSNDIFMVPLDGRPVNSGLPGRIAEHGGMKLSRPPIRILGSLRKSADRRHIFKTLMSGPRGGVTIVSIDALAYGGLVQSRTPETTPEEASASLEVIKEFRKRYPDTSLYAFVTVPRDAVTAGDKQSFIAWKRQMKGTDGSKSSVRGRNLSVIHEMIRWTQEGVFDFLLIGKEDTAEGNPFRKELADIESAISRRCPDKAALAAGADELSVILTARALSEISGCHPAIYFDVSEPLSESVPLYEPFPLINTLQNQAIAAGAWIMKEPENADVVISVHTAGRQKDIFLDALSGKAEKVDGNKNTASKTVSRIGEMLESGRRVALVDAEFINGSSGALINALLRENMYFRLTSYAGWNTTANSSGTVIAHSVADVIATSFSKKRAARNRMGFLMDRLFSDFLYSVVARPRMIGEGCNPFDTENPSRVSGRIREVLNKSSRVVFGDFLLGNKVELSPEIDITGEIKELEVKKVVLPWKRLFEADIRLNAKINIS